ncbi:GNAT family N-acetyltransferase [Pleurocapsa sp. PCC 7319]|uniref:GNAT family N-acetyltransferase n=1 Tax=Pleurocapsa sp. PCC 7319 TaxID=118161 RepID=UPI000349638E|nr:hypothetical protein [Pleurocapsa sp. PCC 7319]
MNPLLDRLIYDNFVEATREFGRWGRSNQLIEQDGLMCILGGTTFPIFTNCVVRLDRQIPAREAIDRAKSWFQPHARDFTIYTYGEEDRDLEEQLSSLQLQQLFDTPVMVLDSEVEIPDIPASVEIKVADSEKDILDVRHVNSLGFETLEIPREHTEAIFGVPHRLLSPKIITYIAYLDGQPASTAMTIMTELVAGIYWVSTTPQARGLGLSTICTSLASNAGFQRGARIATLQASPMGESVYQRIGYRSIDRLKCFLVSPS